MGTWGQSLLTSTRMMFFIFSCFVATSLASPLQFERVPSLDNRIPLLVQDRVPNPCLTKANDTCIFPFTYNGVEYFRCTYTDSPTPWCATMVDPNNTVVTNRWGDCSTSQFSNCPEDTPDLPSCTAESGASCIFPFRHLGITYTSCAATDLLSSAWCSTSTHENGTHILGTESVCSSTCPGATATTTTTTTTSTTTAAADLRRTCNTVSGPSAGKPCVFPFTWQGKTRASSGAPPWSTRRATMSLARDNMDSALKDVTRDSGGSRENIFQVNRNKEILN